ncbi:hypothetical protein BER2_4309 [plant metagenome]|uniref:Methyltransferase domain-containing protein n=1 Tax=plant metagenome TaxID=1297885 RepID=A0A484RC57_9ZZZZ
MPAGFPLPDSTVTLSFRRLSCPASRLPLSRLLAVLSLGVAGLSSPLHASAQATQASAQEETFAPQLGRHGKDVMWLPTPDALAERLMRMAGLGPQDIFVDLGAGDGRVSIAAARDFQAQALGVEFDPQMVAVSQRNAREAGVADRARFIEGDIFKADFSQANIVFMYLLPQLNLRLRPTLMAMAPGTRLITHQFHMGRWEPDETTLIAHRPGYLWIVPANAGGQWALSYPLGAGRGQATLDLSQTFQKLKGTVAMGELQTTLRQPRLTGDRIAFAFTDPQGHLREFTGVVTADRLRGTVTGPEDSASFTAKRVGAAPPVGGSEPPSQEELDAAAASLGSE